VPPSHEPGDQLLGDGPCLDQPRQQALAEQPASTTRSTTPTTAAGGALLRPRAPGARAGRLGRRLPRPSAPSPPGGPRRPSLHHVYARAFYTGYGVKTLLLAREAIEGRRWADAERGIVVTAEVLEAFATEVERAAAALASGS
jgi:hypothetical protein